MKTRLILVSAVLALLGPASAMAADDVESMPIADVLNNAEYAGKFRDIKFFFGDQSHPTVAKEFGAVKGNERTNGFAKSSSTACQRAMASTLISLAASAQRLGANAVIGIKSNWKNNTTSSETTYVCGNGTVMSGVALIGTAVNIE